MNIAIVLYSLTGNTLKLAEMARTKLESAGHQVSLHQLQTTPVLDGKSPVSEKDLHITNLPDLGLAEAVVIGCPVWAFRPVMVIKLAISQLGSQLQDKLVLPFVTHAFPWAWLTGTSSGRALQRMAADQGARVLEPVVLSKAIRRTDAEYQAAAEKITAALR